MFTSDSDNESTFLSSISTARLSSISSISSVSTARMSDESIEQKGSNWDFCIPDPNPNDLQENKASCIPPVFHSVASSGKSGSRYFNVYGGDSPGCYQDLYVCLLNYCLLRFNFLLQRKPRSSRSVDDFSKP